MNGTVTIRKSVAPIVFVIVMLGAVACTSNRSATSASATPTSAGATPTSAEATPTSAASSAGLYVVDIGTGDTRRFLDAPEGATEFAVPPGGERIAFQADDETGHPQIFVMSADGTHRRQVSHEPLAAESPGWSPDGARIAFRGLAPDSTYEIYVLDVASGESNRITREKQDVATGYTDQPSWSEDGRTIVFQVEDVIRSVDVETGASSTIIEDAGIADVSPDGSQVAFNTWSTAWVTLADVDGSNRITLLRGGESCCARWSPNGEQIAFQSYPGDKVFVYEPTTGKRRVVGSIAAFFDLVDWLDEQTLLVVM